MTRVKDFGTTATTGASDDYFGIDGTTNGTRNILVSKFLEIAATTLASAGFFLDEDDMSSDSATKVASQQSIKAYVDARVGYALNGSMTSLSSPVDSTTYYIGDEGVVPGTTDGLARVTIPKAGTVKSVYIRFRNAAGGSAETSTVSFRLNSSTDTVVSSVVQNDQAVEVFSNTGLSIAVSAGDYFELKWTTPAWAANPADVRINWQIYVEA